MTWLSGRPYTVLWFDAKFRAAQCPSMSRSITMSPAQPRTISRVQRQRFSRQLVRPPSLPRKCDPVTNSCTQTLQCRHTKSICQSRATCRNPAHARRPRYGIGMCPAALMRPLQSTRSVWLGNLVLSDHEELGSLTAHLASGLPSS